MAHLLNFGPLQTLLEDPDVSEIMVNGAAHIFVERQGHKIRSDAHFASEQELRALVDRIFAHSGKRVGDDIPYADTCLDDGTRINVILAPIARYGISLTLRKFSTHVKTLDDLLRLQTLTPAAARFLVACIKGKVNMLFSGGTSTGKTTLVQILSAEFDPAERVVIIEDAAELRLAQDNVVSLETRTPNPDGSGEVTLRDLIRNALRMAPDRLVLGEVRGPEAIEMVQAMSTGHRGTIGVIHGTSPYEVIMRLETLLLMAGLNLPLTEVRRMICATIPLVVHMQRIDGSRRVTSITELRGVDRERGEIVLNELFTLPAGATALRPVLHYYPQFFQDLERRGLIDSDVFQERPGGAVRART
jgi:pilus assembly protein CpaF